MAVDPIYQFSTTPDGELFYVTPEYALYALGDSMRPSGQWLAGALQQQQTLKQGISAAYSAVGEQTKPRGLDGVAMQGVSGGMRNPFSMPSQRQSFPKFSFGKGKK